MYSITISKLYIDIIIIINLFSSNLQDVVVINAQIIYDDDGQNNQAMMLLLYLFVSMSFFVTPISIIKCVSGADLQLHQK